VIFLLLSLTLAAAPPASDPKAVALADQVMDALGGKAAWDATRFLRFDFAVEVGGKPVMSRSHWWDKHKERYRIEGKTKEGAAYLVLMNLGSHDGQAWLDGKRLAGEEEKKYLDKAYAAWVNDSYWLLMPYKMRDPGVILGYSGPVASGADTWDKLTLAFDNVGLTPKDRYWAYVNRKTHMVDRWEYVLQDRKEPPTRFDWVGWKQYGRIMLSPEKLNAKDNEKIFFPVLAVEDAMPDAVFTSPEPAAR
jgi:hypothetical protein